MKDKIILIIPLDLLDKYSTFTAYRKREIKDALKRYLRILIIDKKTKR